MNTIQEPYLFSFNPIALRKAKIAYNFGLSECNRVKMGVFFHLRITLSKLALCDYAI